MSGIALCGSLSRWAVPLGAAMHNAGYRALGLDWHYVPFEIDEGGLGAAVAAMRALGLRGLGISMPFKLGVLALVDALDPRAARIGAVNTIVNDGGRLTGHNTDWLGAVRALEESRPIAGVRALVLGAGGAARAVAFGLGERGAKVTLCNRTLERAEALARELRARAIPWRERNRGEHEVVVNASSLGMTAIDPASPLDPVGARAGMTVMDIVYKPLETELIRAARSSGATVIHGGRMLLHQAAAQFELYTGRPAPLEAMDAGLRAAMAGEAESARKT